MRSPGPPSRTWFVGDTFEEDIAGAIAAGLQPVWFANGSAANTGVDGIPGVRDWSELMALYLAAWRR